MDGFIDVSIEGFYDFFAFDTAEGIGDAVFDGEDFVSDGVVIGKVSVEGWVFLECVQAGDFVDIGSDGVDGFLGESWCIFLEWGSYEFINVGGSDFLLIACGGCPYFAFLEDDGVDLLTLHIHYSVSVDGVIIDDEGDSELG